MNDIQHSINKIFHSPLSNIVEVNSTELGHFDHVFYRLHAVVAYYGPLILKAMY